MTGGPMGVAMAFNDCINARHITGLAALMTDDHAFIDSSDNAVRTKFACVAAWQGFFAAFPDYRNVFERLKVEGDVVSIAGHSKCSDARLNGPALWSAKVRGGQIAEWRVYEDTPENRSRLGLS